MRRQRADVHDMPILFLSKIVPLNHSPCATATLHICLAPSALVAAARHETAQLPCTRARAQRCSHFSHHSHVYSPRLRVRSHANPTATCSSRMRPSDSLSEMLTDCIIEPLWRGRMGMAGGTPRWLAAHAERARSGARTDLRVARRPCGRHCRCECETPRLAGAAVWASVL